jgi:SRSO17 transposase
MEQRFEVRRKELLKDAEIRPEVSKDMLKRLTDFIVPYTACLGRREQKEHLHVYLEGLSSDLKRKNVEAIAYLHDQDRAALQYFIGCSAWDHEPMMEELCRQVGAELGEEDGVLAFDPSGFKKAGKESVGVTRQWLGRLGKVDNGQVGVFLGYVSRKGHALCDARLYLSEDRSKDRAHRKKCGVPRAIRFQAKQELALSMLDKHGAFLPHRWVTGDDEMGRSSRFRIALRERGEQYLLAIPSNTTVRDLDAEPPLWKGTGPKLKTHFCQVRRWRESLPETAWKTVDVRDGEKGPLVMEIVVRRVQARIDGRRIGPEEWLVVTRAKEGSDWRFAYHLTNAPAHTVPEELARVVKAEHRIEDCFFRAKGEAGLADYEVRTWNGWHHHQTISLMATWFLTLEERRGKKIDPSDHGADCQGTLGVDAA